MPLKIITYVRTQQPTQPIAQHIWNVGDSPFKWIEDIRWIEADGGELDHIRYVFSKYGGSPYDTYDSVERITIPWASKNDQKSIKWYGDIAKTIVANL